MHRVVSLVVLLIAVPLGLLGAQPTPKPAEGVWRNYDFVPGSTVWRATDFSNEPVGRFPASQLEFVRGNMQVVELEGAKVLEATSNSLVRVKLPKALPEAFTIEFSLRVPTANTSTQVFTSPRDGAIAKYPFDYLYIYSSPGIYRAGREVSGTRLPGLVSKTVPVKLQVRDDWAIMYVGPDRVSQVPTANFGRSDTVEFHLSANARFPTYLSDIVVAVGLDDLYATLNTTGEVTTRGILFDSDSDRLRPESTPVLQSLVKALTDHAELKVVIEGHTDGQGDDARNQSLSERRAAAVVAYVTGEGVRADRLTAVGKGETAPVADNATTMQRENDTDGRYVFEDLVLIAKVLNACGLTNRYRVELVVNSPRLAFTVFVTDTLVGLTKTYLAAGPPVTDANAFATCP